MRWLVAEYWHARNILLTPSPLDQRKVLRGIAPQRGSASGQPSLIGRMHLYTPLPWLLR
jgi:hypothetical protein